MLNIEVTNREVKFIKEYLLNMRRLTIQDKRLLLNKMQLAEVGLYDDIYVLAHNEVQFKNFVSEHNKVGVYHLIKKPDDFRGLKKGKRAYLLPNWRLGTIKPKLCWDAMTAKDFQIFEINKHEVLQGQVW